MFFNNKRRLYLLVSAIFPSKILEVGKKALSLHRKKRQGTLAERLGNGLQNRVEQFDSARYLEMKVLKECLSRPFLHTFTNKPDSAYYDMRKR